MKRTANVNPDVQALQYLFLLEAMKDAGYEQYEISNFSKPGFRSRHNSSYWEGKSYLGIGPSAHSFNGNIRQWNVSNNNVYIEAINKNELLFEKETLTATQQLNEYIMISLRTSEGLNLDHIESTWGKEAAETMNQAIVKLMKNGKLEMENKLFKLTNEGKLLADGIAAELFFDHR